MAKQELLGQVTSSRIEFFRISDMNGSPITGLVYNSTSLAAKYYRPGAAGQTISLITQTVAGGYSSGGFVEVDSVGAPGLYRLDVPDAAFAAGVDKVIVTLYGFAGMATTMAEYMIEAVNPQDGTAFGVSRIDVATSTRMATFTLPTNFSALAITAGGAVSLASGQLFIKKNIAVVFPFVMVDSVTGNPKTGLAVTATRSLDGAAFGACANAVTEIANGWYVITLAAADTNATAIGLRFTAAGASDRDVTVYTQA